VWFLTHQRVFASRFTQNPKHIGFFGEKKCVIEGNAVLIEIINNRGNTFAKINACVSMFDRTFDTSAGTLENVVEYIYSVIA